MKNQKKPNTANPGKPALRGFRAVLGLLALLPASLPAFQLEDISIAPAAGQIHLRLGFQKSPGDGEYPLYFQKADPSKGTLTLSFLDTESPFPLGRHAVEPANPAVEEIVLKRVTSPSGKNFLGIELRLKEPPAGEAPVQPQPKGGLKVMLGKGAAGGGKAKPWSLAKSMKSRDEYLNAKAEPAPPEAVPNKVQARPAEPAAQKPAEPVPDRAEARPAEPAPGAAPELQGSAPAAEPSTATEGPAEAAPTVLKEIRLAVTPAQEDLSLVFDPPASVPVHTAQAAADDSTQLEVTLDGVTSALPRKEYALPGSGLFRRVRATRKDGNLVLRLQRASADPIHILPREGGLTLTGGGRGDAAIPFKWSTVKPDAAPPAAVAGAEPVRSAHEEGAAVDAGAGKPGKAGKGKGLSSSGVFNLGKGGKGMILLKDSAALRASPSPKAGTRKKLPMGEKVERVEREGAWLKVISGGDTGYVRANEAVYEDELTEAQAAKLKQDMQALAARIEAQRAKAEAAASAAAAAEAAKTAQAAAQPAEAPAAVVEAEPVRLAAPGVASASKPIPEAAEQAPKGRKAADGPKLSLAESPELADRLAQEKKAAEDEKMRVEPQENRVAYNSYGRRDPFIPVEQGMTDNGIDIDQMKVVGIIWQAQEPMAVLEHNRESGVSFTVKQGDPVHNGRVSRITRDQVTFDISEYGISRSYSLKLVQNKEGKKQ